MSEFKYDAFISYSQSNLNDRKFARGLERFLEAYRPEWSADKYTSEISVFRDTSDLSGNDLSEELYLRLDQSRFLIVVCSKSSKLSEYVGKEISHFLSKRNTSNLILAVLDGDPAVNARDEDSPFRPEIRDIIDEPFGYDFRRSSYHLLEFNNRKLEHRFSILSVITGVEKNLLIDRGRRNRDQRRLIFTASLVFLFVSFLFYSSKLKELVLDGVQPSANELVASYITANDLMLDTIRLGVVEPVPLDKAVRKHNVAYDDFNKLSNAVLADLEGDHAVVFSQIKKHIKSMNLHIREELNYLIGKYNTRKNKDVETKIAGLRLEMFYKTYNEMQIQLGELYDRYESLGPAKLPSDS